MQSLAGLVNEARKRGSHIESLARLVNGARTNFYGACKRGSHTKFLTGLASLEISVVYSLMLIGPQNFSSPAAGKKS